MLFTILFAVFGVSSFISALAIFSALVVAGRNERHPLSDSTTIERLPSLQFHTNKFDEAALKRLAEGI